MGVYNPVTTISDPLRIAAVGFHGLRDLLAELAPSYGGEARVRILDKAYADAVDAIAELHRREGVDVVVSAGSNGSYLRQHLGLPVVLVQPDGLDIMQALAQASQADSPMALVMYGEVAPELSHFNEIFGLRVVLRSYRSSQDAENCVRELRQLGVGAVVAPGMVVDLARAQGLQGVLLYSQGSVRKALDGALEVARVARQEQLKRARLSTILSQLRDGVVAVDPDERIELLNPVMEAILGEGSETLLGRRLGEVCPELGLRQVLRTRRTQAEQVSQVRGRTLVTTGMPIAEGGAVLICQDPVTIQRLDRHLRARPARQGSPVRYGLDDLIGNSAVMAGIRERARAYARSDATVLVQGESGTGKELLAQGIHDASARRDRPFIALNCGAFPESLLESELFGYLEGAFTGAARGGKAGLFEAAHTGTLFLDEIGEMPMPLQTRLLRVLQEKEVLRLGATQPTPVDVRVIAATHADLAARCEQGSFRRDLYYRLNILHIALPPLRERSSDLPALAGRLLHRVAQRLAMDPPPGAEWGQSLASEAAGYAWPGNIRELENVLERAVALRVTRAGGGWQLPDWRLVAPELFCTPQGRPDLLRSTRQHEADHIREVLRRHGGNRTLAARELGISRSTLWRKLQAGA